MVRAKRSSPPAQGAPQYDGAVAQQIAGIQRARMLSATFDVVARRGAGSVTVAHVVERSGVSRRTFYEQFSDRDDCLLAAFERSLALAAERVVPAYESESGWRERLRAGLVAFLAFCDEQPSAARMLVCESLASGGMVAKRRTDVLAALTRIVHEGSREGMATSGFLLAAEGTVGGVLAVIQGRLSTSGLGGASRSRTKGALRAERASDRGRRDAPSLVALTNELMSMIVLPYLGPRAAKRELDRVLPSGPSVPRGDGLLSDPFKDVGMRLTYRTVRVLVAIDRNPDGSNRLVGEAAGMSDQGQISKLLSRLERIGLVENTRIHPGRGAANSWALTEMGRRIAQSIRTNIEGER